MSDSVRSSKPAATQVPPPPPPLPPSRANSNRPGVLQRLVAPLGFGLTPRLPQESHEHQSPESRIQDGSTRMHTFAPLPPQTVAHKTGIPIAAVDISPYKTHAVLAGKEILKTVRITDRKITEDLNLRSAVISYASAHGSPNGGAISSKRRDFLAATDVKWSHTEYDSIIATAANNGRLSIYDVKRPEVELLWLHEHTRQVHKLAFNPFQGYLLLSGSHDGTVKYWDIRTPNRERSNLTLKSSKQFPGRAEAVRDLRWSPTDGVEFITCTDGGTIFKWDSRKPDRPELRINGHERACYAVDWHPDGRHVVSGSADKNVRVWDFKNPDRRQKPRFQFRAPQTVMNIRWRPASWSSATHSNGEWLSTQLAIGYNQDDPRVHIWDLRRPWIPLRELDRYNSPATSLLWCTKDLLWTVGNEGMFTQTDIQHSPQPPEQISPCTMDWLRTGQHAVFSEDRRRRRSIGSEDPSVGFLASSHDGFSSGEQVTTSRSMTDDEGIHEHFPGPSYRHTQASRGSAKSLGNTPPSRDDQLPVLSLHKAVFNREKMFRNRQVGVIGMTTGAAVDLTTVRFLAENYARPASEAERRQNPAQVLHRLQEAFKINGDVCDQVSMHRLGQTWRILSAVILPELHAWADQNRRERLVQVVPKGPSGDTKGNRLIPGIQEPRTEGSQKPEVREGRIGSVQSAKRDLFKGVNRNDWHKITYEAESTSEMTTPVARSQSDSTFSTPSKSTRPFLTPDEAIESISQLPHSVISAHSTAATASRALKSDFDKSLSTAPVDEASSLSNSPEEPRDILVNLAGLRSKPAGSTPKTIKRSKSDWVSSGEFRGGDRRQRQQNKRAALREYKAQARPLVNFDTSFEDSSQSGDLVALHRHDSTDSLQMFSESASSSHKTKSMVSSESPGVSYEKHPSVTSDDWERNHEDSYGRSASSRNDTERPNRRTLQRSTSQSSTRSVSPFPDGPFEFEQPVNLHVQTGARSVSRSSLPLTRQRAAERKISPSPTADELQSVDYIYADFQPIDISTYYTNGHAKAWSALPLISQVIAFDLNLGENHAQFSTHLLMHIHPFFFHRKYRHKRSSALPPTVPLTLADRLLQPHLSQRIIESIFQQHHTFLKSLSLHIPATELRNLCLEFDIPSVYRPRLSPDEDPDTSFNDGSSLSITCTNPTCSAPLNLSGSSSSAANTEPISCIRCNTPRSPCPICLSLKALDPPFPNDNPTRDPASSSARRGLWIFCQSCGHSAHSSCMESWLRRPTTQGECPSAGCGHDCAPGEVRRMRAADLAIAAATSTATNGKGPEESKGRNNGGAEKRASAATAAAGVEGSSAVSVKDSWKAPQSPAVERTRGLLRSSVSGSAGGMGTGTRIGSESDREGGRTGVGWGGRKVVRLMTPGEEMSRTGTGSGTGMGEESSLP